MNLQEAHKAVQDADDNWSAHLTAAYGKRAGNRRYQPSAHHPDHCREAYAALTAARHAFDALGGYPKLFDHNV